MWKLDPARIGSPNQFAEIADGLGDMMYVIFYTANRYGIDLGPVFEEIQRSNMTKVGGVIDVNGKLQKPSTYSPADLTPILLEQLIHGTRHLHDTPTRDRPTSKVGTSPPMVSSPDHASSS